MSLVLGPLQPLKKLRLHRLIHRGLREPGGEGTRLVGYYWTTAFDGVGCDCGYA
jgi:hypothetical protein